MIIGEKSWQQAIGNPLQRLPYIQVKARHAIQSAASGIKQAVHTFGASAGTWTRRFGAVLLIELAMVLFLHLYMLVPLMWLVIPLIAFDYIGLAGVVLYMKIMVSFYGSWFWVKFVKCSGLCAYSFALFGYMFVFPKWWFYAKNTGGICSKSPNFLSQTQNTILKFEHDFSLHLPNLNQGDQLVSKRHFKIGLISRVNLPLFMSKAH